MEVFSKRVTGTDLHFKKNYTGYSCDKEMGGGGRARDHGEPTEGLLSSSSQKEAGLAQAVGQGNQKGSL